MNLDYKNKSDEITAWIKQAVLGAGFEDVVVALSGGIDSALSATLSVNALGKEHVHVLLLPYGKLNTKGTEDAKTVVKFLDLPKDNVHEIDIKKAVNSFRWNSNGTQQTRKSDMAEKSDTLAYRVLSKSYLKIRTGNIMARVRMIYLYDFAKANNCLVVGTENKSEYYLGYFTRFGDEASDIEPIRSLYKTQVKEMAKYLGIPEKIISKSPTAGLWEGQSDEEEFGFSYQDADRILYHHFDEGLPQEAIVDLGIPKETVEKVLSWVAKNDFKRKLPKIFG